ncbi:hypothetical protein RP20_CCG018418 [Aedes albopictus]|nr:hypothetical protein RP20_CCG018418 [Aedes albopictus]
MGLMVAFSAVVSMLTLGPFLWMMFIIIFMASLGKSLGVRRMYVNLLVKIFEYGRQNIEHVRKRQYANLNTSECEEAPPATKVGTPTNNTSDNCVDCAITKPSITTATTNGDASKPLKNGDIANGGNSVISRVESLILLPDMEGARSKSRESNNEDDVDSNEDNDSLEFNLTNCLDYVKSGMEAIIEDEVTSRFEAEELKNWNLLTRTNRHYEFISWRLTVIWVIGFFIRYVILMPCRVFICFVGVVYCVIGFAFVGVVPYRSLRVKANDYVFKHTFRIICRSLSAVIRFHNLEYKPKNCGFCVANHTTPIDIAILSTDHSYSLVMWLTLCTALVGCLPEGATKRWMVKKVLIQCFGVLSSALSSVVNYHNIENRPLNGICVANHTSPIDVLMLMCDNCYSLIGQRHGGFLGVLQRALARASPHIWFERAEAKDRMAVAKRLKEHVSDPNNPPILIFPEGTCINNTSVMQFKKGSFEVGGVIYPVAIKYDARFGDAFWNSSRYSMMQYLYMMMTSWAIVCDVWYLPPMTRGENESAIDFANPSSPSRAVWWIWSGTASSSE